MIGSGLFKATCAALKEVGLLELPADLKMRQFFKRNDQLGRRDRQVVAETVFDVLRHRRRYTHWCTSLGGSAERGLAFCSLATRGQMPEGLEAYIKPWELSERDRDWFARLAIQGHLDEGLLPAVRLSLPDWIFEKLREDLSEEDVVAIGRAALIAAPLDLRVNTLKVDRDQVMAALAALKIEAHVIDWLDNGVRLAGKPALEKTDLFINGWVEVQDAGSQWLAKAVDAKRGQTVVDFCAGAGGKTLAMAANMRNTGQIYAVDISTARLTRMRPRLARANVTNVQPMGIDSALDPKLKRLAAKADRVLVDAPCSGSGTWRRNPDIKWRQSASHLHALTQQQFEILSAAARLVRKGGRLVYSTCSLFSAENERVVDRFLTEGGTAMGFSKANVLPKHPITGDQLAQARLLPHQVDADGFFVCVMERQ